MRRIYGGLCQKFLALSRSLIQFVDRITCTFRFRQTWNTGDWAAHTTGKFFFLLLAFIVQVQCILLRMFTCKHFRMNKRETFFSCFTRSLRTEFISDLFLLWNTFDWALREILWQWQSTVLPRITPQWSYFFVIFSKKGVIRGIVIYYESCQQPTLSENAEIQQWHYSG